MAGTVWLRRPHPTILSPLAVSFLSQCPGTRQCASNQALFEQPHARPPRPSSGLKHGLYFVNVTRCCRLVQATTVSNGTVAFLVNVNSPFRVPVIDPRPALAVISPEIARN